MTLRILDLSALPEHMREQASKQLRGQATSTPAVEQPAKRERRGKYDAQPVRIDEIRFDSKGEGKYYQLLKARLAAGEIKRFHRQVLFDLPGGVTYRCDFLVIELDDSQRYIDWKGMETPEFKMKRKQVRALYNVEIEIP